MARKGASVVATQREQDVLQKALALFGRAEKAYPARAGKCRDRHHAYLGLMSEEEKARWDTPLAPKYALHSVETLIVNLLESRVPKILPRGPEDVETAECFEKLLTQQRERDERAQKDDRFVRETTIMGIGVQKTYWLYRTLTRNFTRWDIDPTTGVGRRVIEEATRPLHDRPSTEPLDIYDWFGDPSASRASQMGWCIARYWVPLDELKRLERKENADGSVEGVYKNLQRLGETNSDAARKASKRHTGRDHGECVEVLELWTPSGTVSIGNREVVIQDDEMLYDHGELPFQVAHTIPDLYTMEGLSVVEVIAPLQAAAWEVLNSLVRNTRVASLLLAKKRRDADMDDDALELATGDIVEMENLDDLDFFHAGASILDAGLQMLGVLKTTMTETSGSNQYLSGGASQTVDNKTATGISLLQSNAAKLLQGWNRSLDHAFNRGGRQEIALNQQFLRSTERLRVEADGGYEFVDVFPWEIAGEYDFSFSSVDAALNEQQRKEQSMLLFDRVLTALPALQQMGLQVKADRALEDLLEAFGKLDVEAYIEPIPMPPAPVEPGADPSALPGGAAGAPPAPGTPAGAGAGGVAPQMVAA